MENFKSYQIYIDSGIKWIGLIPKHWKVTKYKRLFNFINGNGFPERFQGKNEGEFPFYKVSDINFRGKMITSAINYVSLDDLKGNKWNIVKPNSILTAKIGEALKKNHRKINQKNCLIDNNMMALSLNKGSLDYYYYFLSIVDMDWYSNPGTVPSINMRNLREDNLLIPSLEEQDQIAKFLNIKVSQIDDLIVDKEKLIELLEEKRQAIITEAVTKGLNPNVKMKDSGVEWIGEIPEHWEKVKLRYIGEAIIGLTYSPTDVTSEDKGDLVLRSSNIKDGKIIYGNNVYVDRDIPEKLRVKNGDIIICSRNGSRELIGKCALIDKESEGHSFGAFTTVFRSECNNFLYYVFQSQLFKAQIGSFLTSTINQLTIGNLYSFPIALPNMDEQKKIVDYLKNKTTDIDSTIDEQRIIIEKLKEYRQSLIYEAVTGKIDVRDYKKVLS